MSNTSVPAAAEGVPSNFENKLCELRCMASIADKVIVSYIEHALTNNLISVYAASDLAYATRQVSTMAKDLLREYEKERHHA